MIDDKVKIGNKNVEDADEEQLDAIMKIARGRQENSPAQAQRMALEKQKGENQINKADVQGQYSLARQAMAADVQKELVKLRSEYAAQKPQSMSQWEADKWEKMGKGEMTPAEREAFIKFQSDKMAGLAANNANKNPTMNPGLVNPPGKTPILNPPDVPAPAPIPKQNDQLIKKFKGGWTVTGSTAKGKDGKSHRVMGIADDGRVQLDTGEIIEPEGK
jgi:hypothetical protein